jgi:uncharacterized protein YbjT (DUF2867 family)
VKVLFIGDTGKISSACTPLAVERGYEMFLLNRGETNRPVPEGVTVLNGDIRDKESTLAALGDHEFDAVVNWIAFTAEHIEADIEIFRDRTDQYVFISSACLSVASGQPACDRVNAAGQPVLAVFHRQDRQRGPADAGLSRREVPDDDCASIAHV